MLFIHNLLNIPEKRELFFRYSYVYGKDPDAGRDWGQEEKGMTEDEMVGCHH